LIGSFPPEIYWLIVLANGRRQIDRLADFFYLTPIEK
jgi:hypothetical protein